MNISRYTMICLLILPHVAHSWESIVADICPQHGVSPQIATAIIQQESTGDPLALGVTMGRVHQGYFPASIAEAQVTLAVALTLTQNIGIGLMQITWSIWGEKLSMEPHELLDVRTNIETGCKILGDAIREAGNVITGIGWYHSRTPQLRDDYIKRVMSKIED